MKKILLAPVFLMIILINTTLPTYACTVFNASKDSKVLVGNNEDYTDTTTMVWFVPGEKGKFGKVCFGFDFTYPQGGMNDQGLFFDWFASGEIKACPVKPGQMLPGNIKPDLTPSISEILSIYKNYGTPNDKLLETCKTVDEAISFYEKNYEPCFGYAQLMVVDKNGSSAVLTWDWGTNEMKIVRKEGEYQVIGVGTHILEPKFHNGNYTLSSDSFKTLLKDASIDITRYSNIYDLNHGTVEVFNMRDFSKSVKFNLAEELKKGKSNYSLESLFIDKKNRENLILLCVSTIACLGIIVIVLYIFMRKKRNQSRSENKLKEID